MLKEPGKRLALQVLKYAGLSKVITTTDLFELEPVGDGADVGVEEVGPVHVEQPLVLVHPHLGGGGEGGRVGDK